MPNTCFCADDLIIPAFDANAKTSDVSVQLHPGQVHMINYLAGCACFPFRHSADVIRCCVCLGIHELLGPLPSAFTLVEAKMNILQAERFERQKDCAADSVQKWLAAGNIEAARKVVMLSYEEYRRIPTEYWRTRWLSTLEPAVDLLRQCGVNLKLG